jgi:Carboxypeptidase regulatory-like domain
MKRILGISVVLLSMAMACFGQAFTSNLTGIARDQNGGIVPNVSIKLKNTGTNEERQVRTGEDGRYTFSQLLPGVYELTAQAAGFRLFVETNIKLLANQTGAVDIALQLGEVTQRVEVSEDVVSLDTQTANQNITLEQNMVAALPTNTRNPMLLIFATAGVTAPQVGIGSGDADQNYDRFGFNGGRSTGTQVLLDGVSVTAGTGWNGLIYSPSVDSVSEVQLMRNTYDAQYKGGGGVVTMVTKGGQAQYHFSAFDFLRNSQLDANSWANNTNGRPRTVFQRNQFGGNVSGPIWKSKRLFFFGGYEALRQGSPSTSITSLPTDLQRQGNFSQTFNADGTLSVIYNPFTSRPNPNGAGFVRDAFPGNIIPADLLDPVGVKAVALYPQPTGAGNPFTHANNYVGTGKGTSTVDRTDTRVDWARSDKHSVYARYSRAWRINDNPPNGVWQSLAGTGNIAQNPRYQATLGNTIVPSPTWVISLLAGVGSWTERQLSFTKGQNGTAIGLPASFVGLLDAQNIPQIYPTNYSNISYSRDLNNIERTMSGVANVTKEKGAHSLKFGFSWESDRNNGGSIYSADFYFSRGMTSGPVAAVDSSTSGDAIASLLLGTGANNGSNRVQKPAILAINHVRYGTYFQDSWRISSRLTLSPGIRYEVDRPTTERYNRFNNFYYNVPNPLSQAAGMPLSGGLVFLDGDNRFSWNNYWKAIAPRLGFAYKVSERVVVRGGYGIFFPTVLGSGDSTGFSANTPQITSAGGDGIHPQDLLRNPYPNGLIPALGSAQGLLTNVGLAVGSYQRDHPAPHVQNYSLDLQLQLTKKTILLLGYSGNQGRKLAWGNGLNDNKLPDQYLSLGSKLDQPVNNPFFGIITSGNLAARTIPYYRLLKPYPEFDSVNRNSQTPGGSSSYNALLINLSHQFGNGLMLMSSFVWSKAIDNVTETEPSLGGAADSFRDSQNFAIERSLSAHDIPRSFVTSMVYDLPVGKGRRFGSRMNRVLDGAIGGWQIAVITRFSDGFLVDYSAPSTISQYGFGGQYPNITSGADVALANPTPSRWFNTAAFSAPAPYTIGTAPRRIPQLREDSQHNADLAILKNFRLYERLRLQFRGEMFNLTNTPQFGYPNTTFGSPTFGQVTSTTNVPPRNVQFGLRLDF